MGIEARSCTLVAFDTHGHRAGVISFIFSPLKNSEKVGKKWQNEEAMLESSAGDYLLVLIFKLFIVTGAEAAGIGSTVIVLYAYHSSGRHYLWIEN
ncbi:Hypothetical protein NTJ_13830 [Nesidiocoris tenuis]|uniref:Uncharacterized protein n=1 Tax=Nesidiocoris tenuis TaxID=355587 RepID=A0ABN7B9N4_9HEMI|nr:Hypothetical protein NTJ_13830 [Nesidiocoris tenuis]